MTFLHLNFFWKKPQNICGGPFSKLPINFVLLFEKRRHFQLLASLKNILCFQDLFQNFWKIFIWNFSRGAMERPALKLQDDRRVNFILKAIWITLWQIINFENGK